METSANLPIATRSTKTDKCEICTFYPTKSDSVAELEERRKNNELINSVLFNKSTTINQSEKYNRTTHLKILLTKDLKSEFFKDPETLFSENPANAKTICCRIQLFLRCEADKQEQMFLRNSPNFNRQQYENLKAAWRAEKEILNLYKKRMGE